jgi:hypothetical protein
MRDVPIYTSKSTAKSLWQEYRIYGDRVVFGTHFGDMTVPFDNVECVETSESEVVGLLRGDLHLKNFRPALKLDWANFVEHVVLDKREGHIRRILFTPDNLDGFMKALKEALGRYREKGTARRR